MDVGLKIGNIIVSSSVPYRMILVGPRKHRQVVIFLSFLESDLKERRVVAFQSSESVSAVYISQIC